MDLPGFMTIYKDKFFSRIKDFIDDKNYIFALKEKYNKKLEEKIKNNFKENEEEKIDFLGLKRKRLKEDKLSAYDLELKMLESDYPQIIENSNEFIHENVQIKKEKIDDEELNINEISDNNVINKNKKDIQSIQSNLILTEQKSKAHQNNGNINNTNKIIGNVSVNKSKKGSKMKFTFKRQSNKKNIPKSQNNSKNRKGKTQNSSVKKSNISKALSPVKNYNYNNIVTNVFDSVYTANYAINHYQENNQKSMLYGINSRLDKMPKINICKKKRYQMNISAEKLFYKIKDKLSNISNKSKIHKKRKYLSEDKRRREELQNLNQIVNNNFYGKERLKSPDYIRIVESVSSINENSINNDSKSKVSNINNINNLKKKKLKKKKIICLPLNNENKNVSIHYKIILSYKKKKGERIITKSEIIPDAIIIDKSAIKMEEIKMIYESLFPKENNDESNKPKNPATNLREKRQRKVKKVPKTKIRKSTRVIHARRSSRIRELQQNKYKKVKELEKIKYKKQIRRRSKRFQKRRNIKELKKYKKAKISESKKFDSRGESNISNIGNIRTNYEMNMDIDYSENKNDDVILVNKTNRFDSLTDRERYFNKRKSNVKRSNSFTSDYLDEFDTVKGFNLLFNQK